MKNPAGLRVDPDRSYVYKSRFKVLAVRAADALGKLFFAPAGPAIPWNSLKRIAVLRLDHLGDVLLALPALKALEEALPQAQVDFFIGPWAEDLVDMARLRAAPQVFLASWFARDGIKRGTWKSIGELKVLLESGQYDAVLDLRGDFRHILAGYRSGIKTRIGFGRTGLGFLLTCQPVYRQGLHEVQRNFDLLEQAGIKLSNKSEFPQLFPEEEDDRVQHSVREKLGIINPAIAIHATCAATSKRWPVSKWQELIDNLPEKNDVVLIGSESERDGMDEIQKGCKRKIYAIAGLLNLRALTAFLKDCTLFIGVDSGPAHIAAAVGTRVVSLYSGTNVVGQWGPKGLQVTVIQKTTPCSPCELTVCPIGNECMNRIGVDEVLNAVNISLG